jgi:hypothetical protein
LTEFNEIKRLLQQLKRVLSPQFALSLTDVHFVSTGYYLYDLVAEM